MYFKPTKELAAIITICEFLDGDEPTEKQAIQIDSMIAELSIAEKEWLYNQTTYSLPADCYTNLSMRNGEMGGFSRY